MQAPIFSNGIAVICELNPFFGRMVKSLTEKEHNQMMVYLNRIEQGASKEEAIQVLESLEDEEAQKVLVALENFYLLVDRHFKEIQNRSF